MHKKWFRVFCILLLTTLVLPFAAFGPGSAKPAKAYEANWSEAYTTDFTHAYAGIHYGTGANSINLVADLNALKRTTNGGSTWSTVSSMTYTALKHHTDNSTVMWGASSDGVYKSTDTGATWSDINNEDLPDTDTIWDIEIIDITGGHLILATNTTDGALDCSDDGGSTWVDLLDTTNPRGLTIVSGYLYVASDDGLNRIETPTDCTVPTWDTAASGAWSQAYEITIWDGDYFVATDGGVYRGDWVTDWVLEWDTGRVFGFDTSFTILANTETSGVIQRDEPTAAWSQNTNLDLEEVNSFSIGADGNLYAYGATNLTTSYAVWSTPEGPTAVGLCGFWATQESQNLRINWETCWELLNLGFNVYYRNQKYNPADNQIPEYVQINEEFIPGMEEPTVYTETWYYDAQNAVGLCQGPNRILLKDYDAMLGPTDHELVVYGDFALVDSFELTNQEGADIEITTVTASELHIGGMDVEYAYSKCQDVDETTTWYSPPGSLGPNTPGEDMGDKYVLKFQLPDKGNFCFRLVVKDYYTNCNSPYDPNNTYGYYPTMLDVSN